MTHARSTALWVAGLFILATVTSVAALVLIDPVTSADDMAGALSAAPNTVIAGVLLMLASALAIVAIPAMFFPLLSRYSMAGALLYLVVRLFEGLAYVLGALFTLGLLNAARTGAIGQLPLLKDLADIAFAIGPTLFFSLSAILLGVLLWGARLVPRWLSGWTALGGVLMLVQGVLTLAGPLDPAFEAALFMPIALAEMVFALWLILRGFDRGAVSRLGG